MQEENKKKLIYIVDDMKVFHKLYNKFLPGYEIKNFTDSVEALEAIIQSPPDLVLSDLEMPDMDGIEVLKQVRSKERLKDLPFIICTSIATEEKLEKAFAAGVSDFLDKETISGTVLNIRIARTIASSESNEIIKRMAEERMTLLRMICHDLANPLFVAQTTIEKFNTSLPIERMNKSIERMTRSLHTMKEIIEFTRESLALRDKKRQPVLEVCDLKDTVDDLVFLIDEKLKLKNIKLNINGNDNSFKFTAEKKSLVQNCLVNLFTNAIKFTPEGGQIDLNISSNNDVLLFEVLDYGMGIPSELLPKLFNPLEKTSRPGTAGEKGTGYGLPLVKSFIESYGGSISVNSQSVEEFPDDHWTSFRIKLKAVN